MRPRDEPYRRAAVEHVVRICILAPVARFIERLVDLLGGAGTTRRQILVLLPLFGGRVVTTFTIQFMRTRSVAMQRGIVAALTRMAPGLRQAERLDLLMEVMSLGRSAADPPACRDLAGLLAVARQVNAVASSAGA
jgi:hypothetical protein